MKFCQFMGIFRVHAQKQIRKGCQWLTELLHIIAEIKLLVFYGQKLSVIMNALNNSRRSLTSLKG